MSALPAPATSDDRNWLVAMLQGSFASKQHELSKRLSKDERARTFDQAERIERLLVSLGAQPLPGTRHKRAS